MHKNISIFMARANLLESQTSPLAQKVQQIHRIAILI